MKSAELHEAAPVGRRRAPPDKIRANTNGRPAVKFVVRHVIRLPGDAGNRGRVSRLRLGGVAPRDGGGAAPLPR